jgi:hypothetical protein
MSRLSSNLVPARDLINALRSDLRIMGTVLSSTLGGRMRVNGLRVISPSSSNHLNN